ncbi:hypothetical protein NDU88_002463 [Pleurodeles waltl]|uniref:Uncharacterized protein n=1 Tax=Pleurodeles waltl TaxID=8319 RepID=A0AAV7MQL4_PLEWA|nr:hypothetical protein NDU88_002463 [Pleurodeles waltl]
MAQLVDWLGFGKKRCVCDCIVLNFRESEIARRLIFQDMAKKGQGAGIRVLPLGFFYPPAEEYKTCGRRCSLTSDSVEMGRVGLLDSGGSPEGDGAQVWQRDRVTADLLRAGTGGAGESGPCTPAHMHRDAMKDCVGSW